MEQLLRAPAGEAGTLIANAARSVAAVVAPHEPQRHSEGLMDLEMVAMRLIHIGLGVFWAGAIFFIVLFL